MTIKSPLFAKSRIGCQINKKTKTSPLSNLLYPIELNIQHDGRVQNEKNRGHYAARKR